MKIYKVKSTEDKGRQQEVFVYECKYHWCRLNNKDYSHYPYIMNMINYRINDEHRCYVAKTHHLNLNKW